MSCILVSFVLKSFCREWTPGAGATAATRERRDSHRGKLRSMKDQSLSYWTSASSACFLTSLSCQENLQFVLLLASLTLGESKRTQVTSRETVLRTASEVFVKITSAYSVATAATSVHRSGSWDQVSISSKKWAGLQGRGPHSDCNPFAGTSCRLQGLGRLSTYAKHRPPLLTSLPQTLTPCQNHVKTTNPSDSCRPKAALCGGQNALTILVLHQLKNFCLALFSIKSKVSSCFIKFFNPHSPGIINTDLQRTWI